MKIRLFIIPLIIATLVIIACNPFQPLELQTATVTLNTGLTVSGAGSRALTDVASFKLTVTADGMATVEKSFTDETFSLEVTAGASRKFTLQALDSAGNVLYSGSTTVELTAGETTDVVINLGYSGFYVSFETNGGEAVASIYAQAGTTISEPATPTNTGFSFTGWFTDEGLTSAWDFSTDTVTEDITLYAGWTVDGYTITYNLDGGTNNAVNPVSYTAETPTFSLEAPTKPGYTFDGWYIDSGFSTVITEIFTGSTGDLVIYAKWTLSTSSDVYILGNGYISLITSLLDGTSYSYTAGTEYIAGADLYIVTYGTSDTVLQTLVDNNCNFLIDGYFANHSALFDTLYGVDDYGMGRQYSTITDDTHSITTGYSGDIVFSTNGGRIVSVETGIFTELMSYGGKTSLGYQSGTNKVVFGGVFFIYTEDFPDYASTEAKEIFIRCLDWLAL